MDIKKMLTDWKSIGTVWVWIGLAILALNFVFVGPSRWEFWYGLTYGAGWLALGIVLCNSSPSLLGAIGAAFAGVLAVLLNIHAFATDLTAQTSATIGVVLLVAVVAAEYGLLKFGGRKPEAKYLTLLAFGASALFGVLYFYDRFSQHLPLNFQTIMYHGGIMALAGFDFITALGAALHFKETHKIRLVLALVSIAGAALTAGQLGWGLSLA
jgi:hypothetical protein